MKRKNRQLNEEIKLKISASMKGKQKTEQHKKAISDALKKYWESIPNENNKHKNTL